MQPGAQASGSWKRSKEIDFPSEPAERNASCQHLDFSLWDPCWTSDLLNSKMYLCRFKSHFVCGICYSSHRKLTQCSKNAPLHNACLEKCLWAHIPVLVLFLAPPSPHASREAADDGPRPDLPFTPTALSTAAAPPSAGPAGSGLGEKYLSLHQNAKCGFIKYLLSPTGASPCGWCCRPPYLVCTIL